VAGWQLKLAVEGSGGTPSQTAFTLT